MQKGMHKSRIVSIVTNPRKSTTYYRPRAEPTFLGQTSGRTGLCIYYDVRQRSGTKAYTGEEQFLNVDKTICTNMSTQQHQQTYKHCISIDFSMYKSTQHIQSTILLHLKNGVFMKAQGLNWNVISYSRKKPAKGVLVVASKALTIHSSIYWRITIQKYWRNMYRNLPTISGVVRGYLRVYSTYWATASTFPNLPVPDTPVLQYNVPHDIRLI